MGEQLLEMSRCSSKNSTGRSFADDVGCELKREPWKRNYSISGFKEAT